MIDDRIKQWRPFMVRFKGYDGKMVEHTFTCPTCGGHNCKKIQPGSDHFLEGHFRCTDCGETKDIGKPICYYSPCFKRREVKPDAVQLTLF